MEARSSLDRQVPAFQNAVQLHDMPVRFGTPTFALLDLTSREGYSSLSSSFSSGVNQKQKCVPLPPTHHRQHIVPEAELQLETPRFVVRLRIRGTQCRLLGPDLPELRSLLNAPGMGAGCLIMELERAGKNARERRQRWAQRGGGGGSLPYVVV